MVWAPRLPHSSAFQTWPSRGFWGLAPPSFLTSGHSTLRMSQLVKILLFYNPEKRVGVCSEIRRGSREGEDRGLHPTQSQAWSQLCLGGPPSGPSLACSGVLWSQSSEGELSEARLTQCA